MNYLAHLVIGGPDPDLMVGNFMGDSIKGSAYNVLPNGVAAGVLLHRWIDSEADAHLLSQASRADLRPTLGRMSGVGLDLLHDYFLARNFNQILPQWQLESFVDHVESILAERKNEMPDRTQRFFSAMTKHRWLKEYGNREKMLRVCTSMDTRIAWHSNLNELFEAVDRVGEPVLEERFLELISDLMNRKEEKWPSW